MILKLCFDRQNCKLNLISFGCKLFKALIGRSVVDSEESQSGTKRLARDLVPTVVYETKGQPPKEMICNAKRLTKRNFFSISRS